MESKLNECLIEIELLKEQVKSQQIQLNHFNHLVAKEIHQNKDVYSQQNVLIQDLYRRKLISTKIRNFCYNDVKRDGEEQSNSSTMLHTGGGEGGEREIEVLSSRRTPSLNSNSEHHSLRSDYNGFSLGSPRCDLDDEEAMYAPVVNPDLLSRHQQQSNSLAENSSEILNSISPTNEIRKRINSIKVESLSTEKLKRINKNMNRNIHLSNSKQHSPGNSSLYSMRPSKRANTESTPPGDLSRHHQTHQHHQNLHQTHHRPHQHYQHRQRIRHKYPVSPTHMLTSSPQPHDNDLRQDKDVQEMDIDNYDDSSDNSLTATVNKSIDLGHSLIDHCSNINLETELTPSKQRNTRISNVYRVPNFADFEDPPEINEKEGEKRLPVIHEIVKSERTYCNSLWTILDKFSRSMKRRGIVSDKEIRIMCPPCLLPIYNQHCSLLQKLEEALVNYSWKCKLGDVFQTFVESVDSNGNTLLHHYRRYVQLYPAALQQIGRSSCDNPAFKQHLVDVQQSQLCSGLDIRAFLLTPIQRFPRYMLLLKQLLSVTSRCHDDNDDDCYTLDKCLVTLERFLDSLNASIEQSVATVTADSIPPPPVANPKRNKRKAWLVSSFRSNHNHHQNQHENTSTTTITRPAVVQDNPHPLISTPRPLSLPSAEINSCLASNKNRSSKNSGSKLTSIIRNTKSSSKIPDQMLSIPKFKRSLTDNPLPTVSPDCPVVCAAVQCNRDSSGTTVARRESGVAVAAAGNHSNHVGNHSIHVGNHSIHVGNNGNHNALAMSTTTTAAAGSSTPVAIDHNSNDDTLDTSLDSSAIPSELLRSCGTTCSTSALTMPPSSASSSSSSTSFSSSSHAPSHASTSALATRRTDGYSVVSEYVIGRRQSSSAAATTAPTAPTGPTPTAATSALGTSQSVGSSSASASAALVSGHFLMSPERGDGLVAPPSPPPGGVGAGDPSPATNCRGSGGVNTRRASGGSHTATLNTDQVLLRRRIKVEPDFAMPSEYANRRHSDDQADIEPDNVQTDNDISLSFHRSYSQGNLLLNVNSNEKLYQTFHESTERVFNRNDVLRKTSNSEGFARSMININSADKQPVVTYSLQDEYEIDTNSSTRKSWRIPSKKAKLQAIEKPTSDCTLKKKSSIKESLKSILFKKKNLKNKLENENRNMIVNENMETNEEDIEQVTNNF